MIIDNNDVIEFTIYYKKIGNVYVSYSEEEIGKKDKGFLKDIKALHVIMRQLTWNLHNILQELYDKDNNKNYKEKKLSMLLVDWDANKDNIKVEINNKSIANLAPNIAEKILSVYDSLTLLDKKEEIKIAGLVNSQVMNRGRSSSYANRILIENDLIEEFHWLPQDIAKIPYKQLQMFYLVRREKGSARQIRGNLDAEKNKNTAKKR